MLRAAGPVILVAAALLALVWALAYGGGAAPLILGDAGPVVRWGIPVVKLAVNLAAAGMVGTLVVALYALKALGCLRCKVKANDYCAPQPLARAMRASLWIYMDLSGC